MNMGPLSLTGTGVTTAVARPPSHGRRAVTPLGAPSLSGRRALPQPAEPEITMLAQSLPIHHGTHNAAASTGVTAKSARSSGKSSSASCSSIVTSSAPEPTGMSRAKVWSPEVENAFRLQEAGYRALPEFLAMGEGPPECWPPGPGQVEPFIKKLPTRHSLEAGERVMLYFRKAPECEDKCLNRVKLYTYG